MPDPPVDGPNVDWPPPPAPVDRRRRGPRRPSPGRRAVYALFGITAVLVIGTVGFRIIAGTDWVDSFYFESMLATGQGPPFPLTTDDAKLFASAMAFISVGSVVTAIFFTLGPILARFTADRPGEYRLTRHGEMLRCPWHGWEFDIKTGQSWCHPESVKARSYPVEVVPGETLAKGPFVAETVPVTVEQQYVVVEV